jgi:hypothetical protein
MKTNHSKILTSNEYPVCYNCTLSWWKCYVVRFISFPQSPLRQSLETDWKHWIEIPLTRTEASPTGLEIRLYEGELLKSQYPLAPYVEILFKANWDSRKGRAPFFIQLMDIGLLRRCTEWQQRTAQESISAPSYGSGSSRRHYVMLHELKKMWNFSTFKPT